MAPSIRTRCKPVKIRTCIGCRKRDDQAVLLRLVRSGADGVNAVVIDERHRLDGRGAWLHPQPSCVEIALKRKAFNRAFRGAVVVDDVERYLHTLRESSTGDSCTKSSSLKAGQKTDGNPMSTQR